VNQCLETYLHCAIYHTPAKWKAWLALAEFWYNSSHHSSLGCSPFKALYGYDPPVTTAPNLSMTQDMEVSEILVEREAHSELSKQHLQAAQNRMKV
jgi:hypothetical protein